MEIFETPLCNYDAFEKQLRPKFWRPSKTQFETQKEYDLKIEGLNDYGTKYFFLLPKAYYFFEYNLKQEILEVRSEYLRNENCLTLLRKTKQFSGEATNVYGAKFEYEHFDNLELNLKIINYPRTVKQITDVKAGRNILGKSYAIRVKRNKNQAEGEINDLQVVAEVAFSDWRKSHVYTRNNDNVKWGEESPKEVKTEEYLAAGVLKSLFLINMKSKEILGKVGFEGDVERIANFNEVVERITENGEVILTNSGIGAITGVIIGLLIGFGRGCKHYADDMEHGRESLSTPFIYIPSTIIIFLIIGIAIGLAVAIITTLIKKRRPKG